MTSSLAETSAPMGVGSILDSPRVSPSQDAAAVPAQVSPSQSAQEPQHKQLQARTSRPRAAAAAANAVMAEQAKQEEQPIDVTLARALSGQESPKSAAIYIQETSKRPSRVAAAAANAGITRQAKEEEGSLNMLIASTTPKLFEQDGEFSVKKRTKEGVNGPAAKRSKLAATSVTTKLVHNPLEEVSGGSQPSTSRGKKRRQAAVFEAAPIITDMPPLPFTSPTPKGKAKNKLQADGEEDRRCEFCKKVTNICVQLHCQGCRRVYHAGCLLTAFKPFVDVNAPILDQMERLQLEVPERRGNIFRCASCKAAFLDFYESGGFLWDCDCPTCTQPEKLIYYRQRKLVKMMNDMELERQRKKELKDQKAKTQTAGKPYHDDQRREESDAVKMEALGVLNDTESGVKNVVAKEEPMEVDDNEIIEAFQAKNEQIDVQKKQKMDLEAGSESEAATQSKQLGPSDEGTFSAKLVSDEPTTPQMEEHQALKVAHEPVGEPEQLELSGDDLVGAHTPLDQFQPAFRDWCRRQSAAITPTKGRRSHTAKETRFSIMSSPEAAADEPSSSPSRLRALALFKRPKHKGDKGPIVARVTDPASFEFVAQVVCLPPSYVMNMANGGLADRVMRSQMPVPDDSFPRKSGWLAFNRNASTARQITCVCCENRYEFDAFVEHAGISLSELKIKSRQLLYIVERQDESALVPYKTFLLDLEFVTKNNLFLDELHPPSVQLNR
uniref:Tify domain-containing protein n=1 Tax=Phytophthora ramorum TaxID=164328 RepID=H3GHA2_PHYRM